MSLERLQSHRLELVLMGAEFLEALVVGDASHAAHIGGLHIPDPRIFSPRLLRMRLHQMQTNPGIRPWLLRAIVIRESQILCGRIGFHSAPGPEDLRDVAPDGVEIGYAVGERFRRQGYAKEAACALMRWAFGMHRQRCFILSISPENGASLAMARSMGFQEIGSHIDEEDGLELYFERRFTQWPYEWNV